MIGIKGFGLGVLYKKKEPPSSSDSKNTGVYNLSYDGIVAGKILDRLFVAINDSIDRDGNRTSKTMKDLFLTEDTKLGIKRYVVENESMVTELMKGIREDLQLQIKE
jgi:hypothetical protein